MNNHEPSVFLLRAGQGHSQVALPVPSESQGKLLSFLNKNCKAAADVWESVKEAVKSANAEIKKAKEDAAAAQRQLEEQLEKAEKEDLTGDGGIIKQVPLACRCCAGATPRRRGWVPWVALPGDALCTR